MLRNILHERIQPYPFVFYAAVSAVFFLIAPSQAKPKPQAFDAVRDYRGQLAVFPGAQGYGTITPAGRGGKIIRVTSLASEGPGTFRAALEEKEPRTVIFEAAGIIELTRDIEVLHPYLTIAGQTAPPPGITLTGAGIQILTHDVLIQHVRVRLDDAPGRIPPEDRTCLSIRTIPGLRKETSQVVIDHCSFSWASDKNGSTWDRGVHDLTFSHCIFSEGLAYANHPKGEHSKGLLVGDHSRRVAVIGNLFAHNTERNPYVKGDVSCLIVNNVIYNPGFRAIHMSDYTRSGPFLAAVVGNVMIPGPDTPSHMPLVWIHDRPAGSQVYQEGNLILNKNGSPAEDFPLNPSNDWEKVISVQPLTSLPATEVREWVLQNAGARPADRDPVDLRIIQDVRQGTGQIISSPKNVGGLPSVEPVYRKVQIPESPNGDDNGDGYTNLEERLQRLAREIENPSQP